MEISKWEERYRSRERVSEDFAGAPVPILAETAKGVRPGRALDLACGTGRNALWLAQLGWKVTAVDGAMAAIGELRRRAQERGLTVGARVADLERWEYSIAPEAWDLVCICYYLQRDLFAAARKGLVPGGVLVAPNTPYRGERGAQRAPPSPRRTWRVLSRLGNPSRVRRRAE